MDNYDFFESNKSVVIKTKVLTPQDDVGCVVFDDEVNMTIIDETDTYGEVPDHIKKYVKDLAEYCCKQLEHGTLSILVCTPDDPNIRVADVVTYVNPTIDITIDNDTGSTQPFVVAINHKLSLAVINIGSGEDIMRYAIVNVAK